MQAAIKISQNNSKSGRNKLYDVWLQSPAKAGWEYIGTYKQGDIDWVKSAWDKVHVSIQEAG